MAKGFQHQFWQAVKAGADAAAAEYGVEIYFDGPASETEIDAQVNMVKNEMAKNPKAMALAALSTEAVTEILEECAAKDIPVIGFDSGVPDDKTGAVKATASTNNENAAAIAAEKFGENEVIVEAMKNADSKKPVIIGCLSQDAVSASITGRTTGFVNKMAEIAEMYQPGKVSIEGHAKWEKKVADPAIIIEVAVSATTEATAVQTAANSLLGKKPVSANVIDTTDLADFMLLHLNDKNVTYYIGGTETYTYEQIARMFFAAAGKEPVIRHAPPFLFDVLAFINKLKKNGKEAILRFSKWTLTESMVAEHRFGRLSFKEYIEKNA